ncbi:ATP-binding protein, partial [Acinetobacter baumannii]
ATRNHWETKVELDPSVPPLRDAAAIALDRIVQESRTHATKYAEASRVSGALTRTDDHLLLKVSDNGRGLPADIETRRTSGHHGLLGMEQR